MYLLYRYIIQIFVYLNIFGYTVTYQFLFVGIFVFLLGSKAGLHNFYNKKSYLVNDQSYPIVIVFPIKQFHYFLTSVYLFPY